MKPLYHSVAFATLTLAFSACGHHRDVRPGANGLHTVAVKCEEESAGARDCMAQAEHYCKEFEKHAAVVDEQARYVGSMDESTYKSMKTASKVAKTIGASSYGKKSRSIHQEVEDDMHGRNGNTDLGDVAGVGGAVMDDVAGQGYTYTMHFKCQ